MSGDSMGGAPGGHGVVLMAALSAALMALLMGPLLRGALPLVVERTLPPRRRWAVTCFSTAYLALCFAGSLAFLGLAALSQRLAPPALVFAVTCVFTVAWQLSGTRLALVDRCGRLRTSHEAGARAAMDDAAGGARYAGGCLRVCWAPMFMMAAAPMVAMLAAAVVMVWEFRPGRNPFAASRMRRTALGYAAVGVTAALMGVVG